MRSSPAPPLCFPLTVSSPTPREAPPLFCPSSCHLSGSGRRARRSPHTHDSDVPLARAPASGSVFGTVARTLRISFVAPSAQTPSQTCSRPPSPWRRTTPAPRGHAALLQILLPARPLPACRSSESRSAASTLPAPGKRKPSQIPAAFPPARIPLHPPPANPAPRSRPALSRSSRGSEYVPRRPVCTPWHSPTPQSSVHPRAAQTPAGGPPPDAHLAQTSKR